MRRNGIPRKDGTRLLGIVADRDDEIELHVLELIPRLAAGVARVDAVVLLQHPESERIDLAGRPCARAVGPDATVAFGAQEVFANDAPGGVARAQNEDFVWS